MSSSRALAVAVAVLAVTTLGGAPASPAAAADEAATVNGESISLDDFEDAVEASGAVDDATGTADATVARTTLSDLIAGRARLQFLRSYGLEADEATAAERLTRLQAPEVAELGDVYADRPASLGVICARLIPVADEQDGTDAVADLADGAEFADVAERYSTDPAIVEYDGWLTGDAAAPCVALSDLQFDPVLAGAFVDADPGEPVGPLFFESGQGGALSFVMEIATLDEVADAIQAFYGGAEESGSSAGELLFRGWLLDADVTVNPRFGRWDAASASIVALGQE